MLSEWSESLVCPDCAGLLDFASDIRCRCCSFQSAITTPLDLRARNPESVHVEFQRIAPDATTLLSSIETERPHVSFNAPPGVRDSSELLSEMSRHLHKGATVLDLGCGPKDQRGPVESLGFRYLGVDYSNPAADMLVDAHCLPFKNSSFDGILSYAVLEHLYNPFIAIREIERVLKPGGVYIGTVSQGEPFHNSYLHHTAWGVVHLFSSVAHLRIVRLWESNDTLYALSTMGRYPKIIKGLVRLIHFAHIKLPFLAPNRMRWPDKEKRIDRLHRSSAICFAAQKST
jgi:SAM-dependent methyltransferase